MDGTALTTDDIQNLIVMCGDGNVARFRWGPLVLEFFGADEDEEDEPEIAGFTAMPSPTVVSSPDLNEEDEDGYSKLFGGSKPRFKKPTIETAGG